MTATTRTRITATPLYPGSFMPEEGHPVVIADADTRTALAAVDGDDDWFCIEVRTVTQKRWMDGDGAELWTKVSEQGRHRIYVGEELTAEQVEALDGDYSILLSNMRSNSWPTIVRTRRGNWQPPEPGDVVLSEAELAAAGS